MIQSVCAAGAAAALATEIDDPIKAGIHLNDELTSHGQEINLTNHIPPLRAYLHGKLIMVPVFFEQFLLF